MAQSAHNVNVVFGAQVGGLLDGLKLAENAIKQLTYPIRELGESFKYIGEATGLAFAFEKIADWTREVAEAAEKVDILADAFGTSAERMLAFQNTLDVLGGGGQALIRVAAQIGRELQTSLNDPFSKARSAIDAANVSLGDLKSALGRPLQELDALRNIWLSLAGDPRQLQVMTDLVGPRGLTMVLPYLEATGGKVAQIREELSKTGANMPTADIKNLHDMEEQIRLLGKAFEGLKDTIVVYYSDPIKDALKATKEWVEYVKDNIPNINKSISDALAPTINEWRKLRDVPDQMKSKWEAFSRWWDDLQERLGHGRPGGTTPEALRGAQESPGGSAGGAPSGLSGNAKVIGEALGQQLGLNAAQVSGVLANLRRESGFEPGKVGASGDTGIAQWVGERLEALKAAEGPAWNTLQGQVDFLIKELQGRFSGVLTKLRGASTAEEASQIFGGGFEIHHGGRGPAFEAEQAQRNQLAGQIAGGAGAGSAALAGGAGLVDYKADYEKFEANEKRKLAEQKGNTESVLQIYDEWLAHILQIYAKDGEEAGKASKLYQNVESERTRVAESAEDERLRLRIRALDQAEAEELRLLQARQRYGQLTAEQAARAEWAIVQAHRKATEEILKDDQRLSALRIRAQQDTEQKLINLLDRERDRGLAAGQSAAQTLTQGLSGALTNVMTRKESPGQAFAEYGQKILQTVMDNVIQKLIVQTITNLLQQIAADAANTGVLASLLSLLLVKPEVAGFSFAGGGIVPSAAGGWVIPSFQSGGVVARLHSNEMVLPSHISQGFQDMFARGGGAGGVTNLSVTAWDTTTASQQLMRSAQAVGKAFAASQITPRAISAMGRYP